jgi:hypothetical protein
METNAAPNAPDRAAALPPPGAGVSDPNFAVKSFTVISTNKDISIPPESSFLELK